MSDWIEIRVETATTPADWSPFIDVLTSHGCPGSQEEGARLVAYLANVSGVDAVVESIRLGLSTVGECAVLTAEVPDQDWSELWKIHFKARRVGERFVIVPTWETYAAQPCDLVITLDPGQAFGTGDHPTTRLCLQLMETVAIEGKSVLDVGCGSGVLSIGACLLGAAEVEATDIDGQAVAIARENAELNAVTITAEARDGLAESAPKYDVLLSNIISATLIRLAPAIANCVKPGGDWIASGIIAMNWPDVQRGAERAGFELVTFEQEDDWIGAHFRR